MGRGKIKKERKARTKREKREVGRIEREGELNEGGARRSREGR